MTESIIASQAAETVEPTAVQVVERIFAATDTVYGAPVQNGAFTVITAKEVIAGGGFGFGAGTNPTGENQSSTGSGGGGGGGAVGRPVAAIIIGPNGVTVQPILDVGKLGLAALGIVTALLPMLLRMRRASRA